MAQQQLGARIDADLYRELRVLAAQRDTTVAALLEEGIKLVLRKYRQRTAAV